mmetsp:Transcript_9973/g.28350  ORF Transcript_9973/g.28350 Transcript_9973/m.28350 type:complete len:210 (+) Transcript_9973:285-914(+)
MPLARLPVVLAPVLAATLALALRQVALAPPQVALALLQEAAAALALHQVVSVLVVATPLGPWALPQTPAVGSVNLPTLHHSWEWKEVPSKTQVPLYAPTQLLLLGSLRKGTTSGRRVSRNQRPSFLGSRPHRNHLRSPLPCSSSKSSSSLSWLHLAQAKAPAPVGQGPPVHQCLHRWHHHHFLASHSTSFQLPPCRISQPPAFLVAPLW